MKWNFDSGMSSVLCCDSLCKPQWRSAPMTNQLQVRRGTEDNSKVMLLISP